MRILSFIPLGYIHPETFWSRDSALIVKALREMGHEAFFCALAKEGGATDDPTRPLILCNEAQMADPAWWMARKPDAIILNLWGHPRYEAVRRAALQATPRVIERLDASGICAPRMWWQYYFCQYWGFCRQQHRNPVVALTRAVLGTAYFYFFPAARDQPMAAGMARLPWVVAESPLAAARIDRFIRQHVPAGGHAAQISHPVDTAVMNHENAPPKENILVSVGRWDSPQKDFRLLLAGAVAFLQTRPDWSFDIIGGGVDSARLAHVPADVRRRIRIHGILPHDQVAAINRRAKIHFIASRWEGFCVASVEALCCGCSYVGPVNLAASSYLIEFRSGTLAPRRRSEDLCDALVAEAEAWKTGRRDPGAIAAAWADQSSYRSVARRTLALLESIP